MPNLKSSILRRFFYLNIWLMSVLMHFSTWTVITARVNEDFVVNGSWWKPKTVDYYASFLPNESYLLFGKH